MCSVICVVLVFMMRTVVNVCLYSMLHDGNITCFRLGRGFHTPFPIACHQYRNAVVGSHLVAIVTLYIHVDLDFIECSGSNTR